jgi:hypothetical protein
VTRLEMVVQLAAGLLANPVNVHSGEDIIAEMAWTHLKELEEWEHRDPEAEQARLDRLLGKAKEAEPDDGRPSPLRVSADGEPRRGF